TPAKATVIKNSQFGHLTVETEDQSVRLEGLIHGHSTLVRFTSYEEAAAFHQYLRALHQPAEIGKPILMEAAEDESEENVISLRQGKKESITMIKVHRNINQVLDSACEFELITGLDRSAAKQLLA
ncbi:MAG: hypothetical protein AB7G80_08805, partial [Dongiaceae bacterium]